MAVLILVRSAPYASGTTSPGLLASLNCWMTCTRALLSGCWSPRFDHQVIFTGCALAAAGLCVAVPHAASAESVATPPAAPHTVEPHSNRRRLTPRLTSV